MPLLSDEFEDEEPAGAGIVGPASLVLIQVPEGYNGPAVHYGEHILLAAGDTMEAIVDKETDPVRTKVGNAWREISDHWVCHGIGSPDVLTTNRQDLRVAALRPILLATAEECTVPKTWVSPAETTATIPAHRGRPARSIELPPYTTRLASAVERGIGAGKLLAHQVAIAHKLAGEEALAQAIALKEGKSPGARAKGKGPADEADETDTHTVGSPAVAPKDKSHGSQGTGVSAGTKRRFNELEKLETGEEEERKSHLKTQLALDVVLSKGEDLPSRFFITK